MQRARPRSQTEMLFMSKWSGSTFEKYFLFAVRLTRSLTRRSIPQCLSDKYQGAAVGWRPLGGNCTPRLFTAFCYSRLVLHGRLGDKCQHLCADTLNKFAWMRLGMCCSYLTYKVLFSPHQASTDCPPKGQQYLSCNYYNILYVGTIFVI